MKKRIDKSIVKAMTATGLDFRIVNGKRHRHIKCGARLVGILPLGIPSSSKKFATKNLVAQIRRAAKEAKA